MKVVSQLCHCSRCEARTSDTYELLATCSNCGEQHIARMRKGDKPNRYQDCPACGVSDVVYGTMAQAIAAYETGQAEEGTA